MTAGVSHRVVVLTPPGAGAIGVVRLIGPDSVSILNRAFRPASGGGLSPSQGDRLRCYGNAAGMVGLDGIVQHLRV